MNIWISIGTVAVFGAVEFWLAVPTGFAFRLHPAVTCAATITGGVIGVLVVTLPGELIGAWLARRRAGKPRPKSWDRAGRIWDRYGIIGLAFVSPVLPGAPLGALIALVLGASKWRVLLWFSTSLVVWSVGVTLVGAFFLYSLQ